MILKVTAAVMERWRRVGLLLLAFACVALGHLWWLLKDTEPFIPWLWPVLFGAAGVTVALFVIIPRSHRLYQLAGSLVVTAFLMRPISLIARFADGTDPKPRDIAGIIIYAMLAILLAWFWVREVAPWQIRHQAEYMVKGD